MKIFLLKSFLFFSALRFLVFRLNNIFFSLCKISTRIIPHHSAFCMESHLKNATEHTKNILLISIRVSFFHYFISSLSLFFLCSVAYRHVKADGQKQEQRQFFSSIPLASGLLREATHSHCSLHFFFHIN